MKKNLLKEAIADAKTVKEVALANAKIALEEALSPSLTKMLEQKLTEEMYDDETADEDEKVENEEEAAEENETPEEEAEETPEEEEDEKANDKELEEIIKELEGEDENGEEDNTDEDEDEDINIDLEDDDIDVEKKPVDENYEEEGEKMEEPESDEETKKELGEAYKVITFLRSKLNEVNLLNAKLMYVTKLFKGSNLTEGRKVKIIETFDRAKTVREAKLIYSTLVEQVNNISAVRPKSKTSVTSLKESMASKVKPQLGAAKQKQVITESVDAQLARFKKLANI